MSLIWPELIHLGPWAFSISVVGSSGISFVGVYIAMNAPISSQTVPKLSPNGVNY
jgi:hypothetical protein